jgi:hypothetical protein
MTWTQVKLEVPAAKTWVNIASCDPVTSGHRFPDDCSAAAAPLFVLQLLLRATVDLAVNQQIVSDWPLRQPHSVRTCSSSRLQQQLRHRLDLSKRLEWTVGVAQ